MQNIALLIPIIALLIPIVAILTKHKQKQLEIELKHRGANTNSADTIQMQQEIKALKERIIVLERVITDSNSTASLDREIEKLR
jgi:hypothetical protein